MHDNARRGLEGESSSVRRWAAIGANIPTNRAAKENESTATRKPVDVQCSASGQYVAGINREYSLTISGPVG